MPDEGCGRCLGWPPGRRKPAKDGLVPWSFELHAAAVTIHPEDGTLDPFEAIELHPDMLSNRRPLDKLNLAAVGRGIEDTNAKTKRA